MKPDSKSDTSLDMDLKHEDNFVENAIQGKTIFFPDNLKDYPDAPTYALVAEGYDLLEEEKTWSNWRTLKTNWRQVLHTMPYLIACIGQGYDSGANGIAGAMGAFLIKFGEPTAAGSLAIPSLWLSLWGAFLYLGMAFGNAMTGSLVDRWGPRRVILVASVCMFFPVALQCFAVNSIMLLFGKMLGGIPMGIFIVSANNFISESVGIKLRAPMSCLVGLMSNFGLVLGLTVGYMGIGHIDNGWNSWRLLFAVQFLFPGLTIVTVIFAADSPVYAVKKGRPDIALKMIARLNGPKDRHTQARLAVVQQTVAVEQLAHTHYGASHWADLVSNPIDRNRTFTTIGLWVSQAFGGASFLGQGLYFLSQLGINFDIVFSISISLVALSALMSIFTGYILESVGRRNVFVYGNIFHMGILAAVGGLGWAKSTGAGWALAILLNLGISTQVFATNSPAYTLMNEISSFRLRAKTQALSMFCNNVLVCGFNLMVPYVFQAPGNLGSKTALIFAGLEIFVIAFGYAYVPETRNRTAAEIDLLYENKTPARHFEKTDTAVLQHEEIVSHAQGQGHA